MCKYFAIENHNLKQKETIIGNSCLFAIMIDHIKFLRSKAVALRNLAQRAPQIAEALRRLADELDAKADALEQNRDHASDSEDPDMEC
jgi:hypothetical protein